MPKKTYQQNAYGQGGNRKRKLFEDESEEEEEMQGYPETTDNRSTLVKEMFYKDKLQNSGGKTKATR